MYSEPRKMVFTGLVAGAVAIGVGAYVSHSGEAWLPSDDPGVAHGGAGTQRRGNMTSGVVRPAPGDEHGDSAARAASLKAARNSLLRDDVAAARAVERDRSGAPGRSAGAAITANGAAGG